MCTENCDTAENGENFSIYFDILNNKIILYRGIIFNPSDDYNLEIVLPDNLTLSTDLPVQSNIVFAKVTGEVRNFEVDNNIFTLSENTSGEIKSFTINRVGIIDIN